MPLEIEKPCDVDPDKTLYIYGEQNSMEMTCEKFDDLVRLNQQEKVALKYTMLLRESLLVEFGVKFKKNFEIVQHLLGKNSFSLLMCNLGLLETSLQSDTSLLGTFEAHFAKINTQFQELYQTFPMQPTDR